MTDLPLSLYIHFPWCEQKCPYCDFNSHALKKDLPEEEYIQQLVHNFEAMYALTPGRPIRSIFMGGGTPSLFSSEAIDTLLHAISQRASLENGCEITLEANPGSVERARFKRYRQIGINRLSLGIQSFNNEHLKALGRIHDRCDAIDAIDTVKAAGFENFNLDIMYGLPNQQIEQAMADLALALSFAPPHVSWYELTLEPNTAFWRRPPPLPVDEVLVDMMHAGQTQLIDAGYERYEVSAYSQNQACQHNLNYWEFGDYIGIGAGSHSKITQNIDCISRIHQVRHPKQYLLNKDFLQHNTPIARHDLAFEFMLNALRLKKGVSVSVFKARTGLSMECIQATLHEAKTKGWLEPFSEKIVTTPKGYQFLNSVISLFLENEADAHHCQLSA